MAGRWYYRQGTAEYGPLPLEQLAEMARRGQVAATDWVRQGETNPWRPLAKTAELTAVINASRAAAPPVRKPIPTPASFQAGPQPMPAPRPATAPLPRGTPAPMPAPLPAGRAVPTPVAAPQVMTSAPVSGHHEDEPLYRRRKKSPVAMILVIVGCLVGGGLVVGCIAVMSLLNQAQEVAENLAPDAAARNAVEKPVSGSERARAVAAIKSWRKAGKISLVLKDVVAFDVERVYWDDSTAANPKLCVELSVTNRSPNMLNFTSWNSAGKAGAWLVESDNDFVAAATGGGGTSSLEPGKSITEVLRFAVGKKDFDELRLVLPYKTVGFPDQWGGFSISSALLSGTEEEPDQVAVQSKRGTKGKTEPPTTLEIPGIPDEAEESPPLAINPNKAPMPKVDDGEPDEDIRDIIRREREKEKVEAKK